MAKSKPRFAPSTFVGDSGLAVTRIQHEVCAEIVGFLFSYARERYLDAVRLIGKDDDLSARIKNSPGFDPGVLQGAHDRIAAYFCLTHPELIQVNPASLTPPLKEKIARQWRRYFHSEARQLAQDDPIARALLRAVAFQNTDAGVRHVGLLMDRVHERYPLPELPTEPPRPAVSSR